MHATEFLTLSISTQNSEKLNQIGFNSSPPPPPPPPPLIVPVYLYFNGLGSLKILGHPVKKTV